LARTARVKSVTGIYHVMLRGIDRRDIFLADEEYLKFLEYIKRAQEKTVFTLYAYCLMTNHVHLLIETEGLIGEVIKRIAVGYAQYHNIKNGRTGHLFQNRFKSEAVETDKYFLTVLRYIYQNPLKAGIVRDMRKYKWSSYYEYFLNGESMIDKEIAFRYFESKDKFAAFMEEENSDECLDYTAVKRWRDDELKAQITKFTDISKVQDLDKQSRDEVLKTIKHKTKASNRQLSRVLGIGRSIFEGLK